MADLRGLESRIIHYCVLGDLAWVHDSAGFSSADAVSFGDHVFFIASSKSLDRSFAFGSMVWDLVLLSPLGRKYLCCFQYSCNPTDPRGIADWCFVYGGHCFSFVDHHLFGSPEWAREWRVDRFIGVSFEPPVALGSGIGRCDFRTRDYSFIGRLALDGGDCRVGQFSPPAAFPARVIFGSVVLLCVVGGAGRAGRWVVEKVVVRGVCNGRKCRNNWIFIFLILTNIVRMTGEKGEREVEQRQK